VETGNPLVAVNRNRPRSHLQNRNRSLPRNRGRCPHKLAAKTRKGSRLEDSFIKQYIDINDQITCSVLALAFIEEGGILGDPSLEL
jgi:hypothetical protein